jgi:4-hydroxy-tetrahydrodipicolinate synthase
MPAKNHLPTWLTGVLPVLPTPFTSQDEVDYPVMKSLVDFAARCGVKTVVTPAFGSEFYKLDTGERQRVIETTVAQAAQHDLRVVVQCNHTTPRLAARFAAVAHGLGAAAVATALPRVFAVSEGQLMDYACRVCDATDLPVIVQDWNPGGKTADAAFFVELHRACANFRLAKLEIPGIGTTIRTIACDTDGHVGVLTGWGGSYAIEQHGAGLAGLMPGLALADVFIRIWAQLQLGDPNAALGLFCDLSPYLQFSLQTFEQFHHAEKRLLVCRGVLKNAIVRPVTVELDADVSTYLDLLTERLLVTLNTSKYD